MRTGGPWSSRRGRRRCDPVRLPVGMLLQRIGIGRFQLGELAPVQDLLREFVAGLSKFLQQVRGLSPIGPRASSWRRQAHLAEQHVADLLGRGDLEISPPHPLGSLFEAGQNLQKSPERRLSILRSMRMPARSIRPGPAPGVARASRRRSPGVRRRGEASSSATGASDVGILRRIGRGLVDGDAFEGHLVAPVPATIGEGDRLVPEMAAASSSMPCPPLPASST